MGYLDYILFYPLSTDYETDNILYPGKSNNALKFTAHEINATAIIEVMTGLFTTGVTVAENFENIRCTVPSTGSYVTLHGFNYANENTITNTQDTITDLTNLVIDFLVVQR